MPPPSMHVYQRNWGEEHNLSVTKDQRDTVIVACVYILAIALLVRNTDPT